MQLVGFGPIALAPAGPIATHIASTGVAGRFEAARRFVLHALLGTLLFVAGALLATVAAPRAFAADPATIAPPTASIVVTGSVHFVKQAVTFSDTSAGETVSRDWDFGDGSQSHRRNPEHSYTNAGKYAVTLTVRNDGGTSVAMVSVNILSTWTGSVQVYTAGAYSKQATMRLCVAASTQMIRNMVFAEKDHSKLKQSTYNKWGRAHNGFKTPAAAGVDPAGWQSMLRRYVDPGYRIFASFSYANTLKQAARAIRLTGRPAGVFVMHGIHVWVISGFTATADPAITNTFAVTSVSVEGPLFGIRPSINGYDPTPNIRMSVSRFSHYLLPFRDPYEPKGWRNRYVVVIP